MQSLVTALKATSTRTADHAARYGVHAALHHHLLLGLVVFMSASALLGSVLVSHASAAPATNVHCGDPITTSTTLDGDVVCPDTFAGTQAILITASDVTLDLAGYTISAGTTSTTAGVDIYRAGAPPIRDLKVLNGTITGFQVGVRLGNAVETHIRRLAISAPMSNTLSTGISVAPAQGGAALPDCQTHVTICITRNVVSVGGTGIEVTGDDVQVWRNTISADSAIYVTGDRPRVALNRIENCGRFGILVSGYSTYAVVWNNTILGCLIPAGSSTGIYAAAAEGGGSARVRLNHVTKIPGFGIRVADTNALIAGNDSSGNLGNLGSGIVVTGPVEGSNNVVRQNNADNNEANGFNVDPNTIDGGGNHASNNAAGNCEPSDSAFCAGVTP